MSFCHCFDVAGEIRLSSGQAWFEDCQSSVQAKYLATDDKSNHEQRLPHPREISDHGAKVYGAKVYGAKVVYPSD